MQSDYLVVALCIIISHPVPFVADVIVAVHSHRKLYMHVFCLFIINHTVSSSLTGILEKYSGNVL